MAKKQRQSQDIRYAVNKKALKNARAKAAREEAETQRRMESREKSRRMGTVFLCGVLGLIALFCLYTLLRTLLFRRAASLEALRANLLFVSVAAIPILLAAGALLVHRLLKTRRESWSERSRRLSGFLLILVLAAACVLFGLQLRGSRRDASRSPAYAETLAALEQSGLPVAAPDSVDGAETLLEEALCTELRCGRTVLRLNHHADGSGRIAKRFLDQAAWDYADYPLREDGELRVWGPKESGSLARAALALRSGTAVRILELSGPPEELETLLPLLTASLGH